MKITKRQLKRIIREEYSRLKRRGLIRESHTPRKRVLVEGSVKNMLIEIEEMLVEELADDIDAKISMAKAIALIRSNFKLAFKSHSAKDIAEFITSYNDIYHDIFIDPVSGDIMLQHTFDEDEEIIRSPYRFR